MIKIKRAKFIFLLLFILGLSVQVSAVDIDGEVVTSFSYSHIEDKLPKTAISNLETNIKPRLNLGISGIYKNYQYDLKIKGQGQDFAAELTRATVSTTAGPTLLELGKRNWSWGTGFSFSPTYPFTEETSYLGGEANLMSSQYNLTGGLIMNQDNEQLYSGWGRLNSLLPTSDYAVVVSYLRNNSELDKKWLNSRKDKKDGINTGLNYSKDFLNGLEIHSGFNLRYWESTNNTEQQYLLGATYNSSNHKLITCEYYYTGDKHLTLSVRNKGGLTANWSWEVRDVINLDEESQIRSINLSYLGKENITPKLEVYNFVGPEDSPINQKPMDWNVEFTITAQLF